MRTLPPGWTRRTVGDLAKVEYGKALPASRRHASGSVPVVGSAGVAGYHDAPLVDSPLIVVGRKGNAGAVWCLTDPCWPIDTTFFFATPNGISQRFIAHQLASLNLGSLDSSTAVPSLRRADLESVVLVVPPIHEQERILVAIEEHLSRLDAASAANESARSRFGRFSECLLAEIFDSDWPRVPLNSLNEPERPIGYGILKPKTDRPGVVPYVEVRSIVGGEIQVDQLHKTTRELHEAFPRSVLRTGDVVIAVRGSFDRAAVVPPALGGANISRDVARIAPTDALLPRFLSAFLMSPEARRYFAAHARGVAVRGINIGDLRQLPVPAPPLETQRSALAHLGAAQDGLRRLETETHAVAVRGRRLRQAVLAAAFSGQLTGAAT